ncbi:hypothetical protein [Kribbella antiqua]|uniref:hypothetical protein n=1 Tax=Kribbella antiqua TaxID=2512217 RepID=UPI0010451121|nr:hypothetical protein [Kribbella antiqua]
MSLGQYGFYGQGFWDVLAASTNLELVYNLFRWQRGNYSWESPSTAESGVDQPPQGNQSW